MTDFNALIVYAANVDNTALTTASRSFARSCHNEVKKKRKTVKKYSYE